MLLLDQRITHLRPADMSLHVCFFLEQQRAPWRPNLIERGGSFTQGFAEANGGAGLGLPCHARPKCMAASK
jgi:hypothetical protein